MKLSDKLLDEKYAGELQAADEKFLEAYHSGNFARATEIFKEYPEVVYHLDLYDLADLYIRFMNVNAKMASKLRETVWGFVGDGVEFTPNAYVMDFLSTAATRIHDREDTIERILKADRDDRVSS